MCIMKTIIKRTIITKCRRLGSIFACVAVMALLNGSAEGLTPPTIAPTVCVTPACISTAASVMEKMKLSEDPCVNFYKFACGNFLETSVIPDDSSSVNIFTEIDKLVDHDIYNILNEERPKDDHRHYELAIDYYKACMNEDLIEKLDSEPIQKLIKKLGVSQLTDCDCWNYDNKWSWQEAVMNSGRFGLSTDHFIGLSVVVDKKNNKRHILQVDQATTGLHREYLIGGFENPMVMSYLNFLVDIFVISGANRETAKKELRKSVQFEIDLAKISWSLQEREDQDATYNLLTIQELQKSYPYLQWDDYFNGLLPRGVKVRPDEDINVFVPSYFENLGKLINNTNKIVMANYIASRTFTDSIDYLSQKYRLLKLKFYTGSSGEMQEKPRWKTCVKLVADSFRFSVGSLYVQKHFPPSTKSKVMEMITNIRASFLATIKKSTWMDEATKVEAEKKLAKVEAIIGYPEEILNNTLLRELYSSMDDMNPKKFFKSALKTRRFSLNYSFNRLRQEPKRIDWTGLMGPAMVNAYYSEDGNFMEFPAGILRGYVYDKERLDAINYAVLGQIVAHELTHGVDDIGRKHDGTGMRKDWWAPISETEFHKRAQCLVEQYSRYTDEQTGLKLNGNNTKNENIADAGAINEIWFAYKKLIEQKRRPEPRLPGLNYSPEQLLFIAYAQTWCQNAKNETIKNEILTAQHTIGALRGVVPLTNMPEFAKAFDCALNTPMNPTKKCLLW